MKIVIVNRFFAPDQSATSRMATSLATGLAAEGFEVEAIASAMLHDDPACRLPTAEIIDGVQVTRVGATRFGRAGTLGRAADYLTFHVAAAAKLFGRVTKGDVCIVGTDPPLMSVGALPVLSYRRAALVNWLNDLFPEVVFQAGMMRPKSLAGRIALALRDFTLRHASRNVAPIERMAALLEGRGAARARLVTIHHWSEGEAIAPMPSVDSRLRRHWGLGDKFVVGYSGNLGRAHEFGTLLDAAALLKDRADIVFLFVGGGHRLEWTIAEVARQQLTNVLIKPLQPEGQLRDCLAAPDVHFVSLLPAFETSVIPSKFYGVTAAGRPTLFVGDAAGEVARQIREGDCGAVFEVGDAAALAAMITRYADDPALVEALGANARALFDAKFSRNRALAAWREIVASCASDPRPASLRLEPTRAARLP